MLAGSRMSCRGERGTESRERACGIQQLGIDFVDWLRLVLTVAGDSVAVGICERFHRTVQEEFCFVAFRKKTTGR